MTVDFKRSSPTLLTITIINNNAVETFRFVGSIISNQELLIQLYSAMDSRCSVLCLSITEPGLKKKISGANLPNIQDFYNITPWSQIFLTSTLWEALQNIYKPKQPDTRTQDTSHRTQCKEPCTCSFKTVHISLMFVYRVELVICSKL